MLINCSSFVQDLVKILGYSVAIKVKQAFIILFLFFSLQFRQNPQEVLPVFIFVKK